MGNEVRRDTFMTRAARMTALAGVMGGLGVALHAQTTPPAQQTPRAEPPLRASILRGEYGPYHANNDVLFYHLDVRTGSPLPAKARGPASGGRTRISGATRSRACGSASRFRTT